MTTATFQCVRCGSCCRPRGYVKIVEDETKAIAGFLSLPIHEFTSKYTRLMDNRSGISIAEKADGSCVFLSDACECMIQAVKPRQCREFPFLWSYPGFEKICKGMNRTNYERT